MTAHVTATLWTRKDVAEHLGMTPEGARHWLRDQRVTPITGGGRGRKTLYDPNQIRAARADQKRRAEARSRIHHWVQWP